MQVFDALSAFIKTMVYETDYFVEVDSALIMTPKQAEITEG